MEIDQPSYAQLIFVCDNQECSRYDEDRRLYMQQIAPDVFAFPNVMCRCQVSRGMSFQKAMRLKDIIINPDTEDVE